MNDYCTVNNCGEPATHWRADQPTVAWCAAHTPTVTEAAYNCRLCTFLGHTTDTLIDHYYSHARSWRDEALLVERRRQADRHAALDRIAASCDRDQLEEHIYGHVHAWRQEARLTQSVLSALKAASREAALMLHGAARHMDEAAS